MTVNELRIEFPEDSVGKLTSIKWISYCLVSVLVGILVGPAISFSIQKSLVGMLSTFSSIVFGVLGIWIGFSGAQILQKIYSNSELVERKKSWRDLEFLLKPIFMSLFIFTLSTFFPFIGELLKLIGMSEIGKTFFRITGVSIVTLISLTTINLIFLTAKPALEMLVTAKNVIENQQTFKDIFNRSGSNEVDSEKRGKAEESKD